MEKRWLVKDRNPDLLIFALGWACEPQAVATLRLPEYDILCTYDYRSWEPLSETEIGGYRYCYLFAWSFGVKVSELIFPGITFRKTMALNGTPFPVDDRFGIPIRSFRLTLNSLPRTGLEIFERRTYGDFYSTAANWPSSRSFEEKVEELQTLYDLSSTKPETPFFWNEALIGGQDLIFPPANQQNCWQERYPLTRVTWMEKMPHYPFADPQILENFLR